MSCYRRGHTFDEDRVTPGELMNCFAHNIGDADTTLLAKTCHQPRHCVGQLDHHGHAYHRRTLAIAPDQPVRFAKSSRATRSADSRSSAGLTLL